VDLNCCWREFPRRPDTCPSIDRLRRHPSERAYRRCGVGNTEEAADAALDDTFDPAGFRIEQNHHLTPIKTIGARQQCG
jgi:hypothetical protein